MPTYALSINYNQFSGCMASYKLCCRVGCIIEFIAQTECLLCLMFKGSIPLVPPPLSEAYFFLFHLHHLPA